MSSSKQRRRTVVVPSGNGHNQAASNVQEVATNQKKRKSKIPAAPLPIDSRELLQKFEMTDGSKTKIPAALRSSARKRVSNVEVKEAVLQKIEFMENATKNKQGQALDGGQARIVLHVLATEMEDLMHGDVKDLRVADLAIRAAARRCGAGEDAVRKLWEAFEPPTTGSDEDKLSAVATIVDNKANIDKARTERAKGQEKYKKMRKYDIKKYFTSLGDWILIYTPPYCPDLQPIECFWAIIKNRVAKDWYEGRTPKQTWQHLMNAMYGGPREHVDGSWPALQKKTFSGLVRKCKLACNERISDDPLLDGTIEDLIYDPNVPIEGGSEAFEVQHDSDSDSDDEDE
jgi:hypothetical protein